MVIVVDILNILLLSMFTSLYWWLEISDIRGLFCRAKWTKGCINIMCLCTDRAIILPVYEIDFISSGEGHADRMTGYLLDKHTKT